MNANICANAFYDTNVKCYVDKKGEKESEGGGVGRSIDGLQVHDMHSVLPNRHDDMIVCCAVILF